jgi:MATE family multidrug resistance protein
VILVPLMGNHGLWAALVVLNLARGATLGLRYPRLEAQIDR